MRTKILCGNFEKSFLARENMASRKVFWHFLHANFFMFLLMLCRHQWQLSLAATSPLASFSLI